MARLADRRYIAEPNHQHFFNVRLDMQVDGERNSAGAPVISKEGARPAVRVIRTDEAMEIAKGVRSVLAARKPETKP